MPNHSRVTKISKLLRKLRKEQASRKMRWQKLNGDEAPIDYISRRGLLLCYSSEDYPIKHRRRSKNESLNSFENAQLWENFDLKMSAVLKKLSEQKKSFIFDLVGVDSSPFSPTSLNPKKPDPCLGVYMEQLTKLLHSKTLPKGIRNTGKDLLWLLTQKLFESTQLSFDEQFLFRETYQLSCEKRLDPYSYKRRNARKSAHSIDEARAAALIEWLMEEIISTNSLGAASTLLYIWIALQAAFAEITTSVNEILRISDPLNIKPNLQKNLPLIKAGEIHFKEGKLPLPKRLLDIVGAAIDYRSKKPIFQVDPSTIENYLQRANEALGFDNKKDPLALETFLRRPLP